MVFLLVEKVEDRSQIKSEVRLHIFAASWLSPRFGEPILQHVLRWKSNLNVWYLITKRDTAGEIVGGTYGHGKRATIRPISGDISCCF